MTDDRPPQPTGPSIPLNFSYESPSFNIRGVDVNESIRTAYTGYAALVQIGDEAAEISSGRPLTLSNVIFSISSTLISPNAAVLAIKLQNNNDSDQKANVSIETDIFFDQSDLAPIWGLPGQRGFIVYSPNYALTWALRSYPLVTDVTTYWFGAYMDVRSSNWTQVDYEDLNETDSAQAFSWQEISIPAGGTQTRSVIAKFGNFESSAISLTLYFGGWTTPLHYRTSISASGLVIGTSGGTGNLVLVIDDDFTFLYPVLSDISFDGIDFEFNFTVADFGIGQGEHSLSFYAIDSDGNVGEPVTVLSDVIAPTASASQSPSESLSPSPYASLTPAPVNVAIKLASSYQSFDIQGLYGDKVIYTSYYGYTVVLQVNGELTSIGSGLPAVLNDVIISVYPTVISQNVLLVGLKLQNTGNQIRIADVAVSNDIYFDGDDGAPISEIEHGIGFAVTSDNLSLSYILSQSPLVTDVSTFWYGTNIERWSHYWSQTSDKYFKAPDTGFSFSWQGIAVPIGGEIIQSMIIKFGVPQSTGLRLSLTFPPISTGTLYYQDNLSIPGTVSSSVANDNVNIIIVVDDVTTTFTITGFHVGQITVPFKAADHGIGGGPHQLSFYAIDSVGTISPLERNSVVVTIIAPTATPTPSPSSSYSPSPSATPVSVIDIHVDTHPVLSFDIFGGTPDNAILTVGTWGYLAGLRIGDESADMRESQPARLHGLVLTVSHRTLSRNAVLLTLTVVNSGESEIVDFGVAADINLDWHDDAPVAAIGDFRGFSVISPDYKCTYITGKYPLVDIVTVYWYGYYWDRNEARWTQVLDDYYSGADSALSFSWQDVLVAGLSTVKRSVIVKFGDYEIAQLSLELTFPKLEGDFYALNAIDIKGIVRASGALSDLKLIVVVDGAGPEFIEVKGVYQPNSEFELKFVPEEYTNLTGNHDFEFYAVDAFGDISASTSSTKLEVRLTNIEPHHESDGVNVGLAVGLSLGSAALIGLAIGFAVFCLRRPRRRPKDSEATLGSGTASGAEGLKAYMADELPTD